MSDVATFLQDWAVVTVCGIVVGLPILYVVAYVGAMGFFDAKNHSWKNHFLKDEETDG